MEDIVYYNDLYDLYGSLLTEKQRKYFEDYYFNNYSYSEMADEYEVSRNAIFNQIHAVINKLIEYEEKLKLLEKRKVLLDISKNINNLEIKEKLENLI